MVKVTHLKISTAILATSIFLLGTTLCAGVMRAPVASTHNDFGEFDATLDIGNVFDQSGLSANYVSGVTEFDTFLADHLPAVNSLTYGSTIDPSFPGNIDFDLGNLYTISKVGLWNMWFNRGIEEFTVFTDDNPAFSSASNVGTFTAATQLAPDPYPKQVFDVTDSNGRYVRFRVESSHFSITLNFGEIAMETSVNPVPEPSTFAVWPLLGLTITGAFWRRRGSTV